ncbi:MAG: DUF29 domain-containing protein [Candidatus Competibacteraceae bacterium]
MNASSELYEQDFYAWTQVQTATLRAGDLTALDLVNLADEIDSMGIRQRTELKNRLRVLLLHLLKWRFQPAARSSGWEGSIDEQRSQLEILLEDSPSLARLLPEALAAVYPKARRTASRETRLPLSAFPETCPFTLEQVLDDDFWPEDKL